MLLGLLLYIYVDDFDPDKWEKFSKDGKSIYGAAFATTWHVLPEKANDLEKKIITMKKENEIQKKIIIAAKGPGKEACLEPKDNPPISASFTYTRTGIKFNGFTKAYMQYVNNTKNPALRNAISKLDDKKGSVFNINDFGKTFKDISETSCQHRFDRNENNVGSWMTDANSFQHYKNMRNAISRLNK